MSKTNISWTNATWNPVTGCSKVSPGCAHCYAERMDRRIRAAHGEEFKPWTPENAAYNVRLHPERLEAPLTWRKPRMVFVNSMSDLFHGHVPDEFIDSVFATMFKAHTHTFQVLTKRAARMWDYFNYFNPRGGVGNIDRVDKIAQAAGEVYGSSNLFLPLPNVWLGVSVENQRQADERIPLLLQTPAALRFLSCEPLLGEIDLSKYLHCEFYASEPIPPRAGTIGGKPQPAARVRPRVDWVIVGGESGPNFRPMNLDWARSIRDQCRAAGVPFFFKQHSGYRPQSDTLLDGVEHHEFPEGEQ